MSHSIDVLNNSAVQGREGESLLSSLLRNKVDINHSCGGMGSCGTCRIIVHEGLENLNPRNEVEKEMAEDRGFVENERLSCQTCPSKKITIEIP